MSTQPIAGRYEFLLSLLTLLSAKKVVIAQPPLRNRDRVVLQTDSSAIVKLRNSRRIVRSSVISFLSKQHVVFAEPVKTNRRVYSGRLMPKTEMASPGP